MAWSNGRLTEREQGDGIGRVSIDWVVDENRTITYSDLFAFKDETLKNKFKADAEVFKDRQIAKLSKQDSIGVAITTFMNT